jgi:dimethylargininase
VVTTAVPELKAPFVARDTGALRAALVVAPTAALAAVQPVHGESHAIVERAREQFGVFTNRLAVAGVACGALEDGGAAQSLCADLAVVFADGAFLMRPSDLRRRAEIASAEAALGRAGVPILGRIEAPGLLDGGDVLCAGDTLYLGVARQRRAEVGIPAFVHGNALGREQLAAYARTRQLRVVEIPMNADVLRLRSVASLLDAETLVYAPGVLDGSVLGGLKLIEAPRGEDYGAGVLTFGPRRVLANLRFRQTTPLLRKAKIAVESIDLWEFGKLGITPSLLALVLKRE